MNNQVSKSNKTNTKDSINNDTAYKGGFNKDELTKKERKELEEMIDLPNT